MPFPYFSPGLLGTQAAGAAGGGIPTWAILLGIQLLGDALKKEKDPYQEALKFQTQMKMLGMRPPYQSRMLPIIDPVIAQALLAQLNRTSNWGWPAGMGIDTSFIDKAMQAIGAGGFGRVRRRTGD